MAVGLTAFFHQSVSLRTRLLIAENNLGASCGERRTVAAPMPREPPVIKATLPERERERGMDMDSSFQLPVSTCKWPKPERLETRNGKLETIFSRRSPLRLQFAQQQTHQHAVKAVPLIFESSSSACSGVRAAAIDCSVSMLA